MKVVMIYDQVQAGLGGKEKLDIPLGGKTMAIGSSNMLDAGMKEADGKIVACLYCGDGFFDKNKEEVKAKMVGMVNKIKPDVVICGPAYNYEGYAKMCATLANEISTKTNIPAIAAMSKENEDTINSYKDLVDIVVMPKKGGTGLSEALKNICVLAKKKFDNSSDLEDFKSKVCY
ncbi:glycine/betaine/sarcosine/D-proline family reductase selenoprotein B [Romboutsia weinsteinii]|uniref:Glycine/betaine/sarcosine/D-proline family reductase selenoprotein B n=1 Tax=Romboutsia weinsteinii TaxID=2020949 RepID=A0A371J368_9FIRM|nr:GrdB-related putative oxidoreductase [Romboutsia weinsteinii]RDY27116.1 glycine/betaine/sarcosine/D-proline family reductase selenoprotein B [Romboutsia weinsteinii]